MFAAFDPRAMRYWCTQAWCNLSAALNDNRLPRSCSVHRVAANGRERRYLEPGSPRSTNGVVERQQAQANEHGARTRIKATAISGVGNAEPAWQTLRHGFAPCPHRKAQISVHL